MASPDQPASAGFFIAARTTVAEAKAGAARRGTGMQDFESVYLPDEASADELSWLQFVARR